MLYFGLGYANHIEHRKDCQETGVPIRGKGENEKAQSEWLGAFVYYEEFYFELTDGHRCGFASNRRRENAIIDLSILAQEVLQKIPHICCVPFFFRECSANYLSFAINEKRLRITSDIISL